MLTMARIRTYRPDEWTNEAFVECSPTTRLLFFGLMSFCDDGGNHPASAKTLKMEVLPGDDLSVAQVEAMVQELLTNGLIYEYEAAGRKYWHVEDWEMRQKVEKPNYRHPKPHEIGERSANSRRTVGDTSDTEGSGKGIGVGVGVGEGESAHAPAPKFQEIQSILKEEKTEKEKEPGAAATARQWSGGDFVSAPGHIELAAILTVVLEQFPQNATELARALAGKADNIREVVSKYASYHVAKRNNGTITVASHLAALSTWCRDERRFDTKKAAKPNAKPAATAPVVRPQFNLK